jgi:hypothetical protein
MDLIKSGTCEPSASHWASARLGIPWRGGGGGLHEHEIPAFCLGNRALVLVLISYIGSTSETLVGLPYCRLQWIHDPALGKYCDLQAATQTPNTGQVLQFAVRRHTQYWASPIPLPASYSYRILAIPIPKYHPVGGNNPPGDIGYISVIYCAC